MILNVWLKRILKKLSFFESRRSRVYYHLSQWLQFQYCHIIYKLLKYCQYFFFTICVLTVNDKVNTSFILYQVLCITSVVQLWMYISKQPVMYTKGTNIDFSKVCNNKHTTQQTKMVCLLGYYSMHNNLSKTYSLALNMNIFHNRHILTFFYELWGFMMKDQFKTYHV